MIIQDVKPVPELTHEQAMEQMLCARRVGWPPLGKSIEVTEDRWLCGYCGKPYFHSDNPFTCSERCDFLLSEQVHEDWKNR